MIPDRILHACLDDLAGRIDPAIEEANRDAWRAFLDGEWDEPVFEPPGRAAAPANVDWPEIHINHAQDDPDAMVLHQCRMVSDALAAGSSNRLCVRCNYGTGILPSLFGCDVFTMAEETHMLPTTRPLDSSDAVGDLLDRPVPEVTAGLGRKVFETVERFGEHFSRRPELAEHVEIYHPDLQGPLDAADMIWGSGIYLAFYEQPELLRGLLGRVNEAYSAVMRAWERLVPRREYTAHWGYGMRGQLMIRQDSLMNLSPEMYVEFVRPFDQQLIDEFGGVGAFHFCGRGDHYIDVLTEVSSVSAVHCSQPHLNDMETIYRNTIDRGVNLLGVPGEVVDAAQSSGRALHGRVHRAA